MKFWKVEVYNRLKMKKELFIVEYWDKASEVIKILSEVHPEYEDMVVKKTKKPDWVKGWAK